MNITTRFAPSPTGKFHVGSYRTAIFAYLFSRHHKGKFVLRIEDTDRLRSTKEHEENITEALTWLGLEYDEFHRQSERVGEHEAILRTLVAEDKAYVSKEKNQEGEDREVIRFRNPNKKVTFTDMIRGEITFDTSELKDFVIAKSFIEPLFHLVVVADDAEQGVTHVIRGEDHISNTPRQILIYEALDKTIPHYAHLPLVLAEDKSKLSKRKGARPLTEYRELGYLPEAILNYTALLGWNPGTDKELFTLKELTEQFTLDNVQKHGAIYDEVKLRWFNREYLNKVDDKTYIAEVKKYFTPKTLNTLEETGRFERLIPELRERLEVYSDIKTMEESGEFTYLTQAPTYEKEQLLWKKDPEPSSAKKHLEEVSTLLTNLNNADWNKELVKETVWPYAFQEGTGNVLWPMRMALCGKDKSPDPFTLADILGKDETILRLQNAIKLLA